MTLLGAAAAAWIVIGPVGAGLVVIVSVGKRMKRRKPHSTPLRPLLMLLLVELRAGQSVLSALRLVSDYFDDDTDLQRVVNVATVSGIHRALDVCSGNLLILMTQLARAQLSGSSAAEAVRRMLESDLARERARRLASTKALPVRLMIPLTLLILPGVVLFGYGPTLVSLLNDVVVPFD